MRREIKLSGSEISVLKTLGLSGTPMPGKVLVDRLDDVSEAEFIDTLGGLITQGYVLSNKVAVRSMEDALRSVFRTNPAEARDLRDALNPARARAREDQQQRRRRR
ncbi:MAG: hypothetical protein M3R59_08065 [Verrucomicrobiota bacterium]|nr:hypothetical protein [Verrucomicrobiota bacterium]